MLRVTKARDRRMRYSSDTSPSLVSVSESFDVGKRTLFLPVCSMTTPWFGSCDARPEPAVDGFTLWAVVPAYFLCRQHSSVDDGAIKVVSLGRGRAGTHPLWSCWCSRWDFLCRAWGQLAWFSKAVRGHLTRQSLATSLRGTDRQAGIPRRGFSKLLTLICSTLKMRR